MFVEFLSTFAHQLGDDARGASLHVTYSIATTVPTIASIFSSTNVVVIIIIVIIIIIIIAIASAIVVTTATNIIAITIATT